MEQTLILLKPDAYKRNLISEILSRIEKKGFKIVRMELVEFVNDDLLAEHYNELVDKPFYSSIKSYMQSGPVVAIVLQAPNVVRDWRRMIGATNPEDASFGTIRGDLGLAPENDRIENLVHGSDSINSAKREIALWFNF